MEFPDFPDDALLEQKVEILENYRKKVTHNIKTLKSTLGLLVLKDSEWNTYIRSLSPEGQKDEEVKYDEFAIGDNGYITIMDKAYEVMDILESYEDDVDRLLGQLVKHTRYPTTFNHMLQEMPGTSQNSSQNTSLPPPPLTPPTPPPRNNNTLSNVQLPKIPLPKFAGEIQQFPQWWDIFNCTIHQAYISDAQKFQYLSTSLTDKALAAITGIPITNANYVNAIETLKRKFGDVKAIKRNLYNVIQKLPEAPMKTEQIRDTLETLDKSLRQLSALGEDISHASMILKVQEKLPAPILIQLGYAEPAGGWTMDLMRKELDRIIKIREDAQEIAAEAPFKAPETKLKRNVYRQTNQYDQITATAMTTPMLSNTPGTAIRPPQLTYCAFCVNQIHCSDICSAYVTKKARYERARELQLCVRCLRPGHIKTQCSTTRNCALCGQNNHHRAFCNTRWAPEYGNNVPALGKKTTPVKPKIAPKATNMQKPVRSSNAAAVVVTENPPEEEEEEIEDQEEDDRGENSEPEIEDEESEAVISSTVIHDPRYSKKEIVLMIAQTSIVGVSDNSINILIDPGSHRSYLLESVARDLQLPIIKKETLSIHPFGSKEPLLYESPVVKVNLQLINGQSLELQVNVVPFIVRKILRKHMQPEDLSFINEFKIKSKVNPMVNITQDITIHLLLGMDYFWNIMQLNNTTKCPSGLYLVDTKFGYVLSGKQFYKKESITDNGVENIANPIISDEFDPTDVSFSFSNVPKNKPNDHSYDECSLEENLKRIHTQICVKTGIVVMENEFKKLCYMNIGCPNNRQLQQIRPFEHTSYLFYNQSVTHVYCGESCICPTWSTECSHYQGPQIKYSNKNHNDAKILEDEKVDVCSFEQSENCEKTPVIGSFFQVQLYDNTSYLVKSLQLAKTQIKDNEFVCVGVGNITGTPKYCDQHPCVNNGTKFCYYAQNEMVHFIGSYGKILIKSWGVVKKPYYDYIRSRNSSDCNNCKLLCIKGGIKLYSDSVDRAEICTEHHCYHIKYPTSEEAVLFPYEISIYEHDIVTTLWKNGVNIKTLRKTCNADPICELVQCIICTQYFLNCASTIIIAFTLIIVYLGTVITCLIMRSLINTYRTAQDVLYCAFIKPLRCGKHAIIGITKRLRCKPRVNKNTALAPLQNPNFIYLPTRKTSLIGTLAILCGYVQICYSCSETSSLTAKQNVCLVNQKGIQSCTFSDTSMLTLVPNSETCLILSNHHNNVVGKITLKLLNVRSVCKAKSEAFTRNHRIQVDSMHTCPLTDKCDSNNCANMSINEKVDGLTELANRSPGYSYCFPRDCGCFSCWCLRCGIGCIYHRVFSIPKTNVVHKKFSCPVWTTEISLQILLQTDNVTTSHTVRVTPATTHRWNHIKFSILSVSQPPLPLLSSNFLTDGNKTLLLQDVDSNIPDLFCSSYENAKNNNCTFSSNLCSCQPNRDSVNVIPLT